MLIYILLVIEIMILNWLRGFIRISKEAYCTIIGISFVLVTGLRSVNVGADTTVYYNMFEEWKNISIDQVLEKRDFGYFLLMRLVHRFEGSFTVLTLIAAIVFYYPISKLICKYSYDCGLSYLVLMAFNFFQFSMTGIRQTLAFGFAVLCITEMLEKKPNYLKVVLWLAIGITMHRSCILVLFYVLIKICVGRVNLFLAGIGIILGCYLYRNNITEFMSNVFEEVGFDLTIYEGSGAGFTTYLVYLLLLLGGMVLTFRGNEEEKMSDLDLWIMVLAVASQSFVMVNSIFFRAVWYFAIYLVVFIPKFIATSRFDERSKKLVGMAMYLGILFMYFGITVASANVVPYEFFWQG